MKRDEWERYRRQAAHTLSSAHDDAARGAYDWACFEAHQAGQLALKGCVRATSRYATVHAVVKLLADCAAPALPALVDRAKALDEVYIPARYRDAYDSGAPMDYCTATDAATAIDCAQRLFAWADDLAAA